MSTSVPSAPYAASPYAAPPRYSRNTVIIGGVVAFHVLGLWALQSGLLHRAVEIIVPVQILSEFIEPPAPKVTPPPPAPPTPEKKVPVKTKTPVAPPAPKPIAINDPTPAPNAPTGVTQPQPPAPPVAAPVAEAPPPPAPPAPPKIVQPSSDAEHLDNPKPNYPSISKRLGEQGKVIIKVFIGVDGNVQQAEVFRSSGFDRLDQEALKAVQKWRFVPGKRNGVPEAMWFNQPVNFQLQ